MTTQEGSSEELPPNVSDTDATYEIAEVQPSLFGANARATDPRTSHLAARSHRGRGVHRERVMAVLVAAGDNGCTDAEVAMQLPGIHPGSVSKRRGDLVELGLAERSAMHRKTPTGCTAIVWRAVTARTDSQAL